MITILVVAGLLAYLFVALATIGYACAMFASDPSDPLPVFGGAFWPIFWVVYLAWPVLRGTYQLGASLGERRKTRAARAESARTEAARAKAGEGGYR